MNEPQEERWGIHVTLNLPGNCQVMVYEPKHPIAAGMSRATPHNTKRTNLAKPKKKTTARRPRSKKGGRRR